MTGDQVEEIVSALAAKAREIGATKIHLGHTCGQPGAAGCLAQLEGAHTERTVHG